MNQRDDLHHHSLKMSPYLSPVAAWALAFGCAVGWGAFVMPGTTILPTAGPLGSVLGLLIGAAVILIIGSNYTRLMKRYPNAGGSYIYATKVLGSDHGFLAGWMLLLTYIAIIWANATALSVIARYLFGDIFCFGFSYQIAGYTVYMGEVLLSIAAIAVTGLICAMSKKLSKWVQIVCAAILFFGICATFAAVVIHRGGLSGMEPLFREKPSPAMQVLGIIILAPWAFVGFESISHSSEEFRFPKKKIFPILFASIVFAVLAYIMLTLCASMSHPDGFSSWEEYIEKLTKLDGITGLPTFYNAQEAMGPAGIVLLGISALCGIVTGLIGNFIALSRLIFSMSDNGMLPKKLSLQRKDGIPWAAILCVACISSLIPFFGRIAIGWIVEVTTIGAAIAYTYTSICALVIGSREHDRNAQITGLLGAGFSIIFVALYLLPNIRINNALSTESYMILILWSVVGMIVFRVLAGKDKTRSLGRSTIVWLVLFILILTVSISWINRTLAEEASLINEDVRESFAMQAREEGFEPDSDMVRSMGSYLNKRINEFEEVFSRNNFIQAGLVLLSLLVVFSIFSVIKRREQTIEAERIRAEENSRAKSVFLSNMSHDIRTPMNAVTGYTALALKEENLPDNVRDYLIKIDYSGKHLLSLINDILDMSRIESGKVELHNAPADLFRTFDEVLDLFALQMQSKNLKYSVDYSAVTDRYVICDKHRLNRVLLNLISNAFKFTPEGGSVSVVLHQQGRRHGDGNYEITVTDTGIGMSKEFLEHVFDAFERERSHTVDKVQGTGLGMSITKSLVELMGGTIEVNSEQGKGTRFTMLFSFPITDVDMIEEHYDAAEEHHAVLLGKRILVVEDNPINSEIACEILKQEGFETDTAEDGKEALEMVESAPADAYAVVLMDVQMPVMNGYEATKAIRALDGEKSRIPVIAITANTFDDDRKDALDAGMNAFVSKPFNPSDLIATISKFIK